MMSECKPVPYRWIPYYRDFMLFPPVVDNLYWRIESEEQRYLEMFKQLHKVICYVDALNDGINENHDKIVELERLFAQFMESGFDDYYKEQLAEWIAENMPDIISEAMKMVFFGLTMDGYFCAYIPESWAAIQFDTIMDYSSDDYGCLVLSY